MLPYALTIFSSAFLLFQIQPLIGKYILPWFGGGPGVWTTCMLFFQVVLLAGYAYAHLSARFLRPRGQACLHVVLLLGALALQPITPSDGWKPTGDIEPVGQILLLLAGSLGLPYFVLSSTGPLLQQWFSRNNPGVSPYRLYALSNIGSLLALLSYPFFFELHFTRIEQAHLWGWSLAGYAIVCSWCAWLTWRQGKPAATDQRTGDGETTAEAGPTIGRRVLWVLWPACASVLLLATTNKMCQDVAVIPFLWVLPLAIYLISFIVAFDSPRWYVRAPYVLALVAALAAVTWALYAGTDASLRMQVGVYCGALLICCVVCHGELFRLRPHPSRLTGYYLMISAGGALGGIVVALVAPFVFDGFFELHWGLGLCAGLFLLVCFRDREFLQGRSAWWLAVALTLAGLVGIDFLLGWINGRSEDPLAGGTWLTVRIGAGVLGAVLVVGYYKFTARRGPGLWRELGLFWLVAGTAGLGCALRVQATSNDDEVVYRSRNFYGTMAVLERDRGIPADHHFVLEHGRITHGLQLSDEVKSRWPTTYYGPASGVGMALSALHETNRHIGVIGLGTGTIAAYGRPGDRFRLYEINPDVITLASTLFTYLKDSDATCAPVLGDARLSLERESPQAFDALVLDAFSSDAIPVHLLTKEAMALYGRHMKPDGIIAVHISNRYLDLEPVVLNLAHEFGYQVSTIEYHDDEEFDDEAAWWSYTSTWMLLSKNPEVLNTALIRTTAELHTESTKKIPLWTDDFASLFQVLD